MSNYPAGYVEPQSLDDYLELLSNEDSNAIDIEAIVWAYQKLLGCGFHKGSEHGAHMMDRLRTMLEAI